MEKKIEDLIYLERSWTPTLIVYMRFESNHRLRKSLMEYIFFLDQSLPIALVI